MRLFFVCGVVSLSAFAVACSGASTDDSFGQVSSAQRSAGHVEPGNDHGDHVEPGDDHGVHDGGVDDDGVHHHRRGRGK